MIDAFRKTKTLNTLMALALTVTLAACSDDGGGAVDSKPGPDGGHSVDNEACEHMAKGPFADVTAGTDAASAATVAMDHKAYRVSLAANQTGFVKLAAAAIGDHVVFTDTDIAFAIKDDKGGTVSIEESLKSVSACSQVKGKHTFEVPLVGTYVFELGPVAKAAKVLLVIEEADHQH